MPELPFIDVHRTEVDAPPEAAWHAIAEMYSRSDGWAASAFARLLGCADTGRSGSNAGLPTTMAGFHVAHAERPVTIALQGEHRFSRYELRFDVAPLGSGRSQLSAATRAEFPGLAGAAYRAAVIGSGAHRVIVRRMLAQIRRGAEQAAGRTGSRPGQAARLA